MSPNDMEAKPKQKVEGREESTRPGAYFLPPVDIFETRDELVLLADMPGVPPGGVDVSLEGDELTITGRVRPEDYEVWLDPHVSRAELLQPLMISFDAQKLAVFPVSPWVNDARQEGPRCLERVEPESGLF